MKIELQHRGPPEGLPVAGEYEFEAYDDLMDFLARCERVVVRRLIGNRWLVETQTDYD